ncbi:MAG: glycosyltransferase family 4 protein [Anaerolineales bacterium]|nr:glycosyltransferase family 4 protein [Anaerolineales bacterium]MBX3036801.1 glycosyltransferase family 4 protein [Anaerolineales bacterium]
MKILVIIYEFPPIGGGGGRAAYDICKALASRGYDVTVLTAHMQGLPKKEIQDGIHLVRVPSLRTEPFVASFTTMLAFILVGFWVGLGLILFHRPHLIHTHFAVPSGALAWMLSVITGIPYILTAHLGDVPGGVPEKTGSWFRWLEPFTKPIWKHAKKVVAVSEFTRQLALKHYDVNIRVIPNGADVLHLIPTPLEINQPPRLIFAGRFVTQKNPLAIVRILSHLKDLDWTCAMLGDGPMFNEVKQEIEKHNMQTGFYLSGWVTPQDVIKEFSKSDILFMPSLSEGLPVVGVQALAKGLAIVASDIGGFLDLVDHEKNGYLIEVQNEEVFARVIQNLISNPSQLKQFREASLEKAKKFDIQKIANEYEQMIRDVSDAK